MSFPIANSVDVANLSAVAVSVGNVNIPAGSYETVTFPGGINANANVSKRDALQNHVRHGRLVVTQAA